MVASRAILAKSLLQVGAVLLVVAKITCAQQGQIIVGPNIQVSKARADRAHTEVVISANPRDPNHLLGCSIIGSEAPFKASTIAYASFDGGRNWTPTLETNEFFMSTDPACTIGPDGTAYFMADVRTAPDVRLTKVYRSNDGGKTWLPPVGVTFVERPSIAVDGTGGKYHGSVYINGWGGVNDVDGKKKATGISVSRSRNGGRTFEGPSIRAPLEYDRHYVNAMGNCVVLSDGTLACVFSQSNDDAPIAAQVQSVRLDSRLKVITSSNGGETLSDAVTISAYYMLRRPPGKTNNLPSIEVDRGSGPFKDRLYVVWPDVSSGRVEVSFAYSADQGKTWSRPKVINDDQPFDVTDPSQGPDDFMPALAVNHEGVVAVMWYDRRENPDNLGWYVRFRASLDGGETFLPSVRVSEAPAAFGRNERWPVFYWRPVAGGGSPSGGGGLLKLDLEVMGQILNGGDYAGMAADAAGIFHPFWVDNRTGLHQVWTTTVKVNGGVVPHGSADLMDLDDITGRVTLEITSVRYDRTTDKLFVNVRLKNTSKDVLSTPIKARVIALKSEIGGQLQVLNADNDQSAEGAVWDFGSVLKDEILRPGEMTDVKRIIFRLAALRPLARGRNVKLGLVNLEALVLGRIKRTP